MWSALIFISICTYIAIGLLHIVTTHSPDVTYKSRVLMLFGWPLIYILYVWMKLKGQVDE